MLVSKSLFFLNCISFNTKNDPIKFEMYIIINPYNKSN